MGFHFLHENDYAEVIHRFRVKGPHRPHSSRAPVNSGSPRAGSRDQRVVTGLSWTPSEGTSSHEAETVAGRGARR